MHDISVEYEIDCLFKLYNICVEYMERFVRTGPERSIMTIFLYRCEFALEMRDVAERQDSLVREFVGSVEKLFALWIQPVNATH